jgi:hypothetical protein
MTFDDFEPWMSRWRLGLDAGGDAGPASRIARLAAAELGLG